MAIDLDTLSKPENEEYTMPYMEMLTRLEDAHKEFETLMADDYENILSAIIPKVNQQVGMI